MASVGKRKKIIVRLSLVLWRKTCVGCPSSNSECRKGGRKRSDCHLKKGTCPRHGWLRRGPQDCHAMFDAWQCPYKKLSSCMWVSSSSKQWWLQRKRHRRCVLKPWTYFLDAERSFSPFPPLIHRSSLSPHPPTLSLSFINSTARTFLWCAYCANSNYIR